VFANKQDKDFYENEFFSYSYKPCDDPEEIIKTVNPTLECIPLDGNKPLLTNQTCSPGQYKHYHWTVQDFDVINDNAGSSIEFELTPCHGHPEIYIKPQILYAGIPMCQLFETNPNTEGEKTDTWPFPNNKTGTGKQGPDKELFQFEIKSKGTKVLYPGSFFSELTWGLNGSSLGDGGRPQQHTISIPAISYGGFFLSVYCQKESVFQIGITAQQKKEADNHRYQSMDEDTLAMKIRRFGFEVDDKKIESNWVDKIKDKKKTVEVILKAEGYSCNSNMTENPHVCSQNFYVNKFGLSPLSLDKMGPHHPETTARPFSSTEKNSTIGDFCNKFVLKKDCEERCCKWSAEGDSDIADFLKFGPFLLRKEIEKNKGICRPSTTKQSVCVHAKETIDMTIDSAACKDDKARDKGGCDRNVQATMEVTFYTGETGGNSTDNPDTWPFFQLNYIEMNDCASQMGRVGQQYCWEAAFDRHVKDNDVDYVRKAGKSGYKWSYGCGPGVGFRKCIPDHQSRGKCYWDGSPNPKNHNETIEKPWTNNSIDCNMWTPCGIMRNGLPVMIEHKKGKDDLIQREIPVRNKRGKLLFDVPGSIYIYGHVTDITRESVDSTPQNIIYNREVFTGEKAWRQFPARTWVRVTVPTFNNVTYFYNVLRKVTQNSSVESYNGASAITYFYQSTQVTSNNTIFMIAAVIIGVLAILVIPFLYTKHKINLHLKKVYQQHKQRGRVNAQSKKSDKVGKFDGKVVE